MNNKLKYNGLTALGALLCIAPPAVVTLCYFPLWVEKSSSATVSGLSLILILISIIPLFRIIKEHIASPSITLIWIIVGVFCIAFKAIIDQILVISFVGALSSIAGTIVFRVRPKEDKQGAEKEKE
jgi:chromate transport protein ChrA